MTDKAKLYSALIKARAEMQNPTKDKSGYGYKYADLAQLTHICVPILAKFDLGIIQPISYEGDRIVIETRVIHGESGECISEKCSWPRMQGKGMNEVQAMGSVITYGRRYALAAMLGIAQEDEDAAELRSAKQPKAIISDVQAAEIKQLIMETESDTKGLLRFAMCDSIDEMLEEKYSAVKTLLLKKAEKAKKE